METWNKKNKHTHSVRSKKEHIDFDQAQFLLINCACLIGIGFHLYDNYTVQKKEQKD